MQSDFDEKKIAKQTPQNLFTENNTEARSISMESSRMSRAHRSNTILYDMQRSERDV